MTADDFTRVGIGMALISGFLLAPQLIGIARIQRTEQWAKQRLEKGHWSLHTRARTERDFDPFFSVAPILWWTAIVGVISGLSWALLGIASYILLALTTSLSHWICAVAAALAVVALSAWRSSAWLMAAIWFPRWIAVQVAAKVAGWLVSWLRGNDRLLGIITVVGVVLFVAGNVLQFIGTFDESSAR